MPYLLPILILGLSLTFRSTQYSSRQKLTPRVTAHQLPRKHPATRDRPFAASIRVFCHTTSTWRSCKEGRVRDLEASLHLGLNRFGLARLFLGC